ncbi:MAG: LysR family transcriptional regulator [Hyphomicrobiaceae bacterium]
MDLRQIRYFLALFEAGSITRAAQRLNVVQPAVSMQIRRLEDEHGVTLFTRTPQGLQPTPFASELYELCCRVANDVDRVEQFLGGARGHLTGELKIGVPPSLALSRLGEILVAFHARHPHVRLKVHEGYSGHLVEWLGSGEIDIAVMTAPEPDERLSFRTILEEELVLVLGAGADSVAGESIEAAALTDLPLVLPTERNMLRGFIEDELARAGLRVAPQLEVDSLATVLSILEAGGWASILPAIALARAPSGRRLRTVRIVAPSLRRALVVANKRSRPLSEAGEAFSAQLAGSLGTGDEAIRPRAV